MTHRQMRAAAGAVLLTIGVIAFGYSRASGSSARQPVRQRVARTGIPAGADLPGAHAPKEARLYYVDFAVRELGVGITPSAMEEAAWARETWSGPRLARLYADLSQPAGPAAFDASFTRLLVQPAGGGMPIAVDANGVVRYRGKQYALKPDAFLRCFLALQPSLPGSYLRGHYPWAGPESAGK